MTTNRQNRAKGFTLSELLVVVAIIGVLVAIAIPVFTSSLANAQKATCQANTRSLKGAVSSAYMSNGNDKQKAAESGIESMGLSSDNIIILDPSYSISAGSLCPEGGIYTITFTDGSVEVRCSKHSDSKLLGESPAVMDELGAILFTLGGNADSAGSKEGSAGYTTKLLEELEKIGIDLKAEGAVSWAWRPSNDYPKLYWSSVDISETSMEGKTGIPLMSYNPKTKLYMVYKGTVGITTSSKGNIYTRQDVVTKNGLSYEEAYIIYQQLLSEYQQSS